MIMHPADSETYLQHFERVMALQAAILERPSSEHYPEYRELLLRSRGGCALSAVGKLYCLLIFLSIAGVILVLLVVFGRFFLHLT